jgi:N-hydroxyarylamine O-acetyltransferase
MTGAPDIAAYFARIGYSGPRTPSLTTLQAIVARHPATIPFENFEVLLKRPVRLDPTSLRSKLVDRLRGGYCFEQNSLLLNVLGTLGFDVTGLMARVVWGVPAGHSLPRTHMVLRVKLSEGYYLADVGFGGLNPTAPLAFELSTEQATPHETYRLAKADTEFELQARLGEVWIGLYRFSLLPQIAADYEMANWFTSTHPESLFRCHLLVARAGEGCRYSLFDNQLTTHYLADGRKRQVLSGAAELGEVLSQFFGIVLEDPADLEAAATLIEQIAGAGSANPFDANG